MAKNNLYAELERKAVRAIISRSFYRWESAVILSLSLALTLLTAVGIVPVLFGVLGWWFWLGLGLVGELAFVWSSTQDANFRARAVDEMFRERFDLRRIGNDKLRQQVEKALEYRERIDQVIYGNREGVMQEHLRDTSRDITHWLENVFRLARRIDTYERDEVIHQDRKAVDPAINELKKQLGAESDPTVQRQISQSIAQRQIQRDNLLKLENVMKQAQFQLDSTITAIATVYSQMMILSARDVASGRATRLQQEIAGQVQALQDVVQTLDEVYQARTDTMGLNTVQAP